MRITTLLFSFSAVMQKNHTVSSLCFALISFLTDFFADVSIGTLSAVFISTGAGIFTILKARESWLSDRDKRRHQKRLDDLEMQLKLKEFKN